MFLYSTFQLEQTVGMRHFQKAVLSQQPWKKKRKQKIMTMKNNNVHVTWQRLTRIILTAEKVGRKNVSHKKNMCQDQIIENQCEIFFFLIIIICGHTFLTILESNTLTNFLLALPVFLIV